MTDSIEEVKKELLACARRAYAIGLQTGNGGNLSARPAGTEQVVIKGSGTSFGECSMDNLSTAPASLPGKSEPIWPSTG
jgi:ribulose-5-phosphate 4-epimerase/fuculose-1-phosphate aldolase